jgi:RHS repeat-associated protein
MYKGRKRCNLQKFFVYLLTFILFFQFTGISALAIPIKEKKNTLSLSGTFSPKPLPEIPQREKSELAQKILKDDLIQPHAVKELNHTLKSIRDIIGKIEEKIGKGEDQAIQIKYLQAKYESLKDLDKKVGNNLRIKQNKLKEQKAPTAVQKRSANLLAHYRKNIEPVLSRLETILRQDTDVYEKGTLKIESKAGFFANLLEFKNYFDTNVTVGPEKPKLAPSPPSFRPSNFKPIKPDTSGRVKPAYLLQKSRRKTTDKVLPEKTLKTAPQTLSSESSSTTSGAISILSVPPPDPEDLEETIDVVITQEMRDLVASLNNSPARIFEWVKKNIEVEFYYGSLKGSRGAFVEQAGNDIDTVSLLLALYRAANIPCRYVTGAIELPIEKAKNLTGVDDPQKVGDFVASAGIPSVLIVSGSEIIAIQMEHTWAEALVDYDPYAAAKAGEGDLWVPVSPWYKPYEYDNGVDLVTMSGFDAESYLDDFITDVKPESPVDLYKLYFEDYLKANDPGMSWQDGLRTREIKPEKFRTLPNTLNLEVVSVNGEYAELPDDMRHKVTLNVPQVSLSYSFNLSEVVGKKVTYSYPPADEASKTLIDSSGGIENVDPLAVNLLPSIKIEGEAVATGDVVNAGYYHTLRTTFSMPGQGSDFVEYSVISGAYYAVGLDPQLVSNKFLVDRIAEYISTVGDTPENTDNMDEITGEAIYLAVMKYFNDCNTGDTILAQSLKDVSLKQTSGAITGKSLVVYTLFGIPSDLEPGGYFVDAKRNIYTPISISGDDSRELDFMILGGYNASYHEHNLFEEFFHLEAISTVKLLSLANEQGMPVYDIDSSNIDVILPLLGVDASVKSAIESSVAAGHVVKIHQDNLTVKNWSGAGYVDRDPTTNAAGFIISGGLSGGATVEIDPSTGEIIVDGVRTGTFLAGEPVNIANGNLFEKEEDFTIPSRGMPISFVRYYNSQSDYNGSMGYGWTHTYNQHVTENADESVTYFAEDGGEFTFTKNPDTTYNRPAGFFSTLTKDGSGYKLRGKHGTEKFFDLTGKIISIVDRNGNAITFEYTGDYLTKIIDTVGREYSLLYDPDNHLASITTPGPCEWTYSYENDDLMSVTVPGGYTRTYAYYADHNLASITDARGFITSFDYYSNDKVHINYFPNGGTYIFSYNSPLRTTTVTDPEGNINVHYYNEKGAITGHLDVLGYEELYEYDEDLNRVKITDKNGGIIKSTYDSMGNVLSTTNQENYTVSHTYDPDYNFVLTTTDPEARVTTQTYDANGNLEHIIYPPVDADTSEIQFEYDALGHMVLTTDQNLNQTKFEYYVDTGYLQRITNDYGDVTHFNYLTEFTYDDVGKIISTKDAKNNTKTFSYIDFDRISQITSPAPFNYITKFEYDEKGNIIKIEKQTDDPLNPWQTVINTYTSMGKLETTTDGLTNTTEYQYNLNNQVATITDAEGHITQFQYDIRGLLEETIDALNYVTTRSYTPIGNLETIIDARGNPTLYEYDRLNRLINTKFADGSIEGLQYDSMNNVSQKVTRKGEIISYTYDALYRLEEKTYPDASTVSYSYDKGSRLISVADKNGAIQYEYDRLNRIINTTYPGDTEVGYEYDSLGNRTKLTYPDSTYINYSYDELNRLKGINDQASQELIGYDYDALSLRKSLTLLNGNQSTYQYDEINRLLGLTNQTSSLSTISSFDYTYDNVGNRKSMTTLQGMHSYTYDAIYQLMGADYPEGYEFPDTGYTYDSLGNRIHIDKQGTAVNYAANSMNQYTSVGDAAYAYDENGNLISDGESAYEYDYENRLISASNLSHPSISYEYDPFGRRVEKNVDGAITKYIYDGDQVICEADGSGTITAKYVYGAGIDEVVTMQRGGNTYFYHYDGLGNVSNITDAIGSVVESYSYDAYGNSLDTSSVGNPYLFNGRRFDTETGLYNYRARYYDPEIGRFLQTDPLGYYDNFNLYSYVNNNPLNWVDPFGLCKDKSKWHKFWQKIGETIYVFFQAAVSTIYGPITGMAIDPNLPEAAEGVPHIVWESRIKKNLLGGEITLEEYLELHNLHSSNRWEELKLRYQEILR